MVDCAEVARVTRSRRLIEGKTYVSHVGAALAKIRFLKRT